MLLDVVYVMFVGCCLVAVVHRSLFVVRCCPLCVFVCRGVCVVRCALCVVRCALCAVWRLKVSVLCFGCCCSCTLFVD